MRIGTTDGGRLLPVIVALALLPTANPATADPECIKAPTKQCVAKVLAATKRNVS